MGRFIRDTGVATLDYNKQPLPLIGTWASYGTGTFGLHVYDSDGQPVSAMNTGMSQANSYSEFFQNNSQTQTNNGSYSQITSAQPTSYGFGVKGTMSAGVDGNAYLWAGPNGDFGARGNAIPAQMAYFGVVVGPEGYRQNFSLYQAGQTFRQQSKMGLFALDQFTVTAAEATLANVTTAITGLGGASVATNVAACGLIAYHRSLGKLCWLELRDGATSYRMHVWKHPKRQLTGKLGELTRFIREAKAGTDGASYAYYDLTMPASAASYPETLVRGRLIPSNDDTRYSFVRMWPNNFVETTVLTVSGANAITVSARQTTATLTTTYGCESGGIYGIRHQVSWDNKWIVAYAPYYYYGVGMVGYVINVDDPSLTYLLSWTDSADGNQIQPFGKSGFIMGRSSVNADGGAGLSTAMFDPGSGFQRDGITALVNQGAITLTWQSGHFDTDYTSTSYPCLVPIDRWFMPAGAIANG